MFKIFSILIIAALFLASCSTKVQNEFVITGDLDTTIDAKLFLQKRMDGPLMTIDSTQITGGQFKLKGVIDYPEVYYLTVPATKSSVPFFIEPSEIIVNIRTKDIDKTKITGSKTQAAYDAYLDKIDAYNATIKENYGLYNTAMGEGDTEKMDYYDSLITTLDQQRSLFSKNYVLQNPASFISPYIVYRNSYDYELEDLDRAVNSFDTSLTHSVYTGFLNDYLAVLKRTAVGQRYIPFSMADSSGVEVSLNDFVGKNYLLLDFWHRDSTFSAFLSTPNATAG